MTNSIETLNAKIAAQSSRIEQLTAENAHIKNRHQYIRALAVCIIEHSGGRMDWRGALEDARGLCQAVDDVFQNVPATDAALREIQAQAIIKAAQFIPTILNRQHLIASRVITTLETYAAQVKAGEVQL